MKPSSLTDLTQQLGTLLEEKDKEYGQSATIAGDLLKILYPTGIQDSDYENVTLLVRIFDKMKRIASGSTSENSWQDIAGYGILGWRKTVDSKNNELVINKIKKLEEEYALKAMQEQADSRLPPSNEDPEHQTFSQAG